MRRREKPLILVIDDTEANRFVVTGILRKAGYPVIEAGTGKEALVQMEQRPDLVIADVRLPDTTGFEIARTLRNRPDRDLVPILFISASFTGPGAYIQGLESGADAYLTHPVDAGVLQATVRSLLKIRRAEEVERFLSDASQQFVQSLEPDEVARALVRVSVGRVADACVVCQLAPEGVRVAAAAHARPERSHALQEAFIAHPPRVDTGDVVAVPFGQKQIEPYPLTGERGEALASLGLATGFTAPMVARGHVFGSVTFYSEEKAIDDATTRLFVEAANRAALATDNARLFRLADDARKEAQVANSAKMDFLAAMSHELRTPLNAISGYVDLLMMEIRGPLTEPQRDDLRRIAQNQRHLSSLIEDILNYARLEAGRLEFDMEPVLVRDALAEVAALMEAAYNGKGITLTYQVDEDDTRALADSDRLRQVLVNLLGNAVKFTNRGGTVSLTATRQGGEVVIVCRDSGRGIPRDKLDSIFEPFVQVAHRFSEHREGLGLGLSISRDLMRGMGGDLRVESEVGKGSAFTLVLASGDALSTERLSAPTAEGVR